MADGTAAPDPYVSLTTKLHGLGDLLNQVGGWVPGHAETSKLLGALLAYAEHGDKILEAAEHGFHAVEEIMTPHRPDGWEGAQQLPQPDDRQAQLTAELAQSAQDLEKLRQRLDRYEGAATRDERDQTISELRQQLAAAQGTNQPPVTVEPVPPSDVPAASSVGEQQAGASDTPYEPAPGTQAPPDVAPEPGPPAGSAGPFGGSQS